MKILFLGDVIGPSGCKSVRDYLPQIRKKNKIDFTFMFTDGENSYIPIRFFIKLVQY